MQAHNFKNLVGQKFGALSPARALAREERPDPRKTYWECLCDCGKTTVVPGGDLQQGKVKSCGCRATVRLTAEEKQRRKEERRPHEREVYRRWYAENRAKGKPAHGNGFKDITGRVFGRLTVMRASDQKLYPKSKNAVWVCQCECGNTKVADTRDLQRGLVKSCGCLIKTVEQFTPEELAYQKRRRRESALKWRQNNPDWHKTPTFIANQKRWRAKNEARVKEWMFKSHCKKYGITPERFAELLAEQKEVCAICHRPNSVKTRLHIDHDHAHCPDTKSCGQCVRGLLCQQCNHMLGNAEDNIAFLQAAIDYLKKWQTKPAEVA